MRFTITGRNINLTPGLQKAAEDKLGKLEKYFQPDTEAIVTMSVEKERQQIEVTIPVKGRIIRAEQVSSDMYTSIDLVIEKLERQIHKHKTKIQRRFRDGALKTDVFAEAPQPIEEEEGEFQIVKKKKFFVRPMDVQEAIMQMNLLNHDFFVYRDGESGEVCVVYRRGDGKYGLIESDDK